MNAILILLLVGAGVVLVMRGVRSATSVVAMLILSYFAFLYLHWVWRLLERSTLVLLIPDLHSYGAFALLLLFLAAVSAALPASNKG